MQNNKVNKMENTPILKLLVTMSLPAIISMLVQSMYNIVDSIFVAQIGEEALTAVSLAFPIQIVIIAIAVGTGTGINSLISRSLGEKKRDKANTIASYGIIMGIFSSIIFVILGLLIPRMFIEMFTQDNDVIDMGTSYVTITMIFSIGVFIQIIVEKIFQATGNMMYSMLIQLLGAIINIVLDPIFIFGMFGVPAMGVAGAGVATVIGQISAMILSIILLSRKSSNIKIKIRGIKLEWKVIKEIYKIGIPAILMQSITAVVVIILNYTLMAFSQTAVAVLGIYFKLQSFIFMPIFGLSHGAMPIIGYSYGSKNKERVLKTLNISIIFSIIMSGTGMLIFNIIPKELIMMFNGDEELFEIGIIALRILSTSFVFAGVSIIFSVFFLALGRGMKSLIISSTRQLIILVPLAVLLPKLWGINGVWIAFPISEMIAIILSIIFFISEYKITLKNLGKDQQTIQRRKL